MYVADPIDPNIVQKPHYPKELVYANNTDRSMEEIRAQLYLERYFIFIRHNNTMRKELFGYNIYYLACKSIIVIITLVYYFYIL